MNIGIIGYGVVGQTIDVAFGPFCDIYINDIKDIGKETKEIEEICNDCYYIFVCVPTPYSTTKKEIDTSILEGVLDRISATGINCIVIIKSTITPKTVTRIIAKHKDLNIVINPEILTQKQAIHDFANQPILIVGGNKKQIDKVLFIYRNYSLCNKQAKIGICKPEEAALLKYMFNSMMATNNIFLNEFKELYDTLELEGDYNDFLNLYLLDARMGVFPFSYKIPGPDGDIGYGGKCLPKDTKSIIEEAKINGINLSLMEAVDRKNEKIRNNKDWKTIEGAETNE